MNSLPEIVSEDDLQLFRSTGKLFLMDAIAQILYKKVGNSIIWNQWKETLESTLKYNISNEEAEPWCFIGISNPDLTSYLDFDQSRTSFESVKIIEKIVEIFKNAMKASIENNQI